MFFKGLPFDALDSVQSTFVAHIKGKTILQANVGVLLGLPELPGFYEISVALHIQKFCATQHEDHGTCTFL